MNISISIFLPASQTCSGELQQGVQQADGDRVPAGISQPWIWIQQRLVFMKDVGDHFGDDIEEDGDCVPTCVFTVLDMDIAKDCFVEVVVVKMKNCHFETSLVTKNYWLQSVLFSAKTLDGFFCGQNLSTPKTLKTRPEWAR